MDVQNSKFSEILKRNNKQIRDDRAVAIVEDAELEYKREIENMDRDLKKLYRKREAMLDLSPGNSFSLTPEKFDAAAFVEADLSLGLQIRELAIKIEVAKTKYAELFGDPVVAAIASNS